jgi:hypothetical protein
MNPKGNSFSIEIPVPDQIGSDEQKLNKKKRSK